MLDWREILMVQNSQCSSRGPKCEPHTMGGGSETRVSGDMETYVGKLINNKIKS